MRADPAPRVFVIAEAGVNHNGSVELGERLIDAALAAGADAVKFQSFRADSLVSRAAPRREGAVLGQRAPARQARPRAPRATRTRRGSNADMARKRDSSRRTRRYDAIR
jgi:hypothetical protein